MNTTTLLRRVRSVLVLAPLLMLAGPGVALAAPSEDGGGDGEFTNPFEEISPDLSVLGPGFNSTWGRVGSAIWAISFIVVAAKLIFAFTKMRSAERRGYAQEVSEYTGEAKVAFIAFAGLLLLGVIVGSIIFVVQPG